ncbi:hypothetical protein [Larkinella arboricola]
MANQQATNLIDSTVNSFNGDTTSISTIDGISLIDHWLTALRSEETDETAQQITQTLSELKSQLMEGNQDTAQIATLLDDLAGQTQQAAQSVDDDKVKLQLDQLVQTLQDFKKVIAGEAGNIDEKHGRAQIFTQTGTGSATGNPGVNPAVPGNSNTDDVGNLQGGGAYKSYGSGYSSGSSGDSAASNSGTDSRNKRPSTGDGGGNSRQI